MRCVLDGRLVSNAHAEIGKCFDKSVNHCILADISISTDEKATRVQHSDGQSMVLAATVTDLKSTNHTFVTGTGNCHFNDLIVSTDVPHEAGETLRSRRPKSLRHGLFVTFAGELS